MPISCHLQECKALLVFTNVISALEVFLNVMRYINPRFTYFTYLLTSREGVSGYKSDACIDREWLCYDDVTINIIL